MSDQFITFDGDVWLVAGRGVTNEAGEIFCHLSSTTRRLGKSPHTGRPIIQEWNDVYSYWATVAFADGESL